MVKLIEIAATMVIIMLGEKISNYYKPDLIELHLLNGDVTYIKVGEKNNYSCPKTCKANHFLSTKILNSTSNDKSYNLIYNTKQKNQISLNGVDVIDAFEIIEEKKNKKNKKPKTERNRLDLKNFINKYN